MSCAESHAAQAAEIGDKYGVTQTAAEIFGENCGVKKVWIVTDFGQISEGEIG